MLVFVFILTRASSLLNFIFVVSLLGLRDSIISFVLTALQNRGILQNTLTVKKLNITLNGNISEQPTVYRY